MLYLDYAASAPLCEEALLVLTKSMKTDFANPSAAHKMGKELAKKIELSREFFLESLGASSSDKFIFTSSATESNNMLVIGFQRKGKILYSEADHPSLVKPIEKLRDEGREVQNIPLNKDGTINLEELAKLIDNETALLACSHINNTSGTIQPLQEVCQVVKAKNPSIHIHVDGVQAYSKIPIDVNDCLIDSYSCSSHKIEGPKGIGGLYLKETVQLPALLLGGNQENGLRSSTQAAPLIFAFEAAAKRNWEMREEFYSQAKELNIKIRQELKDVTFSFPFEKSSPYIISLIVPKISSDIILRHLEQKDIFLSSSSACSSKIKGERPTFKALGIDSRFHKNVIRISLSAKLSSSEIEFFIKEFNQTIEELRSLMG